METRLILAGLLVLSVFTSGCICCCDTGGLGGLTDRDGEDYDTDYYEECETPYIQVGSDCCLDYNSNNVCDYDEGTEVTETTETTETTVSTATTQSTIQTTTTTQATTTLKSTYNCVKNAGYDPDKAIYVYSNNCGRSFISSVETAAVRSGVDFEYINIGTLEPEEIKALECFYGGYYQGNAEFSYCPRMLCPKTGKIENVDGKRPVTSQASGFAKNCV